MRSALRRAAAVAGAPPFASTVIFLLHRRSQPGADKLRDPGPVLLLGSVSCWFVDLLTETPEAGTPLVPADPPDLSNGPHFFYALQWWSFGLLAMFGFGYLAWEEATGRAELRRAQQPAKRPSGGAPPSEGAHHTAVDGQHGAGDEQRGGAEQERRGTAEL